MFVSPHSPSGASARSSDFPSSDSEYTTLGGTWSCTSRCRPAGPTRRDGRAGRGGRRRRAPLVVVCLLDTAAVDAVIDAASDALADASIVNLTSSTPEDARTTAAGVQGYGARYLDGTMPYARPPMLDVLRFSNTQLAEEVERGEHPGDDDNLDMELAFLDHIVATSRTRGIDTSVPETSRQLVAAAISAGHGQDGFSRVMDVLRRRL